MKKIATLLLGIGSLAAISFSASAYCSPQSEPQYQEQCVPQPCNNDTVCYQVPCNQPVPCTTDTVCNPVPCAPVPCGGC